MGMALFGSRDNLAFQITQRCKERDGAVADTSANCPRARRRAATANDAERRVSPASAFTAHRERLFLCVPRVVRRVHVIDAPGTNSVELDNRLAREPGKMLHSSGPKTKGPGRQCPPSALVELFAHAEAKARKK